MAGVGQEGDSMGMTLTPHEAVSVYFSGFAAGTFLASNNSLARFITGIITLLVAVVLWTWK